MEHYKNTFKIFLILPAGDTVGKYPHSYLKYLCNKSNAVSTGPQMSQNWCWVPRGMGGKKVLIVGIWRMFYGVYTSGIISNIFANLKSFICALFFSFHSCLIIHVVQNSLFYNLIVRLGKLKWIIHHKKKSKYIPWLHITQWTKYEQLNHVLASRYDDGHNNNVWLVFFFPSSKI